ncbi:DUF664 domain-containing protein [Cohnella sp. CFH 77786]|uniref:DinB family protein n=1 Tax=Cohnella sp. CFH 77786 TaxID=2662265 RepID=UPI001C60C37C|nr:DinB family protein [Cohnella sp. CFH 77786]MBW5446973.1 DUF664 domain-containing protein [Cohnella sp. CFH 77786]
MSKAELLIFNLEEVRRRSIKVWKGIPASMLGWKPDDKAIGINEMIRHVLDAERYYHLAIENRGSLPSYESPYENREFISVEDELAVAQPYRRAFLDAIRSYTDEELAAIRIDRSDAGYVRTLQDMLLRVAYHEAVHTGQLLDYLRTAGIDRPRVWD